MQLDSIKIVLVHTKHPGNIGAAARAMKVMGLSSLYLVNPAIFPSSEAQAMAANATDLLKKAVIVNDLDKAIADCTLVVGTSIRVRGISLPLFDPAQGMQKVLQESNKQIALIFGREDRGLTNQELQKCHMQVCIPSESSLNLAASVQILTYELRKAYLGKPIKEVEYESLANFADMESFYTNLSKLLEISGFFQHSNMIKIMDKMRRMFGRMRPNKIEINIIHGAIKKILNKLTEK